MNRVNIFPVDPRHREAFYALAAEYLPDSDPEQMAAYESRYPDAFLVAEQAGKVVGAAFGWPRCYADPADPSFELKGIAIAWEHWRKGCGRRLLAAFEQAARGYGATSVSLGSAGGFVEKFYLACGYSPREYKVWVNGVPAVEKIFATQEDYRDYQRLNPDGFVVMEKLL